MEAVFLKLVNMSLTASWLVLAVILFRIFLKKAPKYIRVALWGLVGLRLMLPISIESVLSLIPSSEPLPEEFLYAAIPQINTGIPLVNNRLNPIIAQSLTPEGLTSANPTQIWSFILSWVWVIGIVLMLSYALISYLLIRRKVGPSIPVEKNLRLCDDIDTPFILGILRPKIYLPSSLDKATAAHVLAHERAHLKRKDHWWKPLGFLLLTVYWFNPMMWLAYVLLCRDIEMACDEKVVKELDAASKKAYSNALLACSVPRHMIAACPLAFGEVGVKNRIKSVLNYKKPAFWIVLVALIACIVVAVCFLTDPAGKPLADFARDNDNRVQSITIESGDDSYGAYTEKGIEVVLEFLEEVRISRNEISQNRSEDRDSTHTITLHYEKYDCRYCFSKDLTQVWYDNSVKPSLTHAVINPERAEEFFLSSIEAPASDRLAPGDYITTEVTYWPLYSSHFWVEPPTYRYIATEYNFYSEYENETFDVYWQWRRVADSIEDLKFFFEWYQVIEEMGIQELPALEDSFRYQKIDEKHHLLLIDDVLYLVEGYDTGTDLTNVGAIYKLEPDDQSDIPTTYPESAISDQVSNLYSTISGQIYDSRDAKHMLIRNAILSNQNVYKSGDIFYAESHQIHGEAIACGADNGDGSPVGYSVIDVMAVVMKAERTDSGIVPSLKPEYEFINATITIDNYADGTLKLSAYQENEPGNLNDYELTSLKQHCYDQAVRYWGMNTDLMVDDLLDTISSSPAQYSNAQPYIETHAEEYETLLHLGEHTLTCCFHAFLNNRASGIRAEIMAAACRDIAKVMGEDIDFEGQYINGPTWFDAFHAEALKLYEANGLDALAQTNRASWVLLNILGQTPVPAPAEIAAEIVNSQHHTNCISLHVDVTFPESIKVAAMEEIPLPESVMLDYASKRGEQSISPTSSTTEGIDEQTNTIHYHFVFELYEGEPADSHFSLTMSGFPETNPGEAVMLSWQADVDDAREFSAKSGDSDVTMVISPYLLNVEFTNSGYDSISDLQDSIQIWDKEGRLLPIRGTYSGGESKYRLSLSITLLEPVDIDAIKTVKVGGLILE